METKLKKLVGKEVTLSHPYYPLILIKGILMEMKTEDVIAWTGCGYTIDYEGDKIYRIKLPYDRDIVMFTKENVVEVHLDINLIEIN